uniref:Coiled-coil domain containing 162 n=1 Tax=Aotus nancymaae TaxID=37293 RepID=A0A2K5EWT7_AOTNA
MFKTLPEKAAFKALKQTLQLIAPLHDIMAYFVSFAKLGNCPACFEFPLSPNPLRGDWGGAEGIGSELRELQNMIDSLQNPQDPTRVAQALLRTEVMFLQFDAAVRRLIQGTFLAAGNVPAYQSVTDNMYHGLLALSNSLRKSIFASQFHLPQPLDPRSLQAFELVPWRTFLEDGRPFPVMSSSPDTLEYNMQLSLCGLSDRDCKVAHGELVGVQLLLEDVLGSYHVTMEGPPRQQATLPDWSKVPGFRRFRSQFQSSPKASELLEGPCNAVMSLALLRSFLILWKQLELQGQDINSVSLHKQFSELYETDILYSSMKAIGKEDEFEGFISVLPPSGASEIEIKTHQLQKLLEKFEIHMIQEVLRKVNREMTLVLSEKTWPHKSSHSPSPQIRCKHIETLIDITFRRDHLEACLLSLGCDVMARECSNFETYSMCYEHVLHHARQRLSQKEQELDATQTGHGPPEDSAGQVAELSHDMIMEITALRAQLIDLEEVNLNLKKQIRKEVQEEYEALVELLCNLQEKLDENQFNLIQKVCELISEVRTEGTDNMKDLKKKWSSASPDEGMKENPAKEQLWALERDNCGLATLVCKVRSLGRWRLAVQQACFQAQPSRSEKEFIESKKQCLRIKLMAEREVGLFCQQVLALRQALARTVRMWKQQDSQAQLLKELKHRVTQDALTQQEPDFMKTSSMEKLLEDVGQKEQQLQLLSEEAERASKLGQLHTKHLYFSFSLQMRARLAKERSMKLDALQCVKELQSQLHDAQQSAVPMGSPGGLISQAQYSPSSASTSSRYSQQHFLKTNLTGSKITGQIQRPQTLPIKHKKRTDDVFPPNMAENVHLTAFQVQTAPSRFPFRADW